jgi:hypothetical protein
MICDYIKQINQNNFNFNLFHNFYLLIRRIRDKFNIRYIQN